MKKPAQGKLTGSQWLRDLLNSRALCRVASEYSDPAGRTVGCTALIAVASVLAHHAIGKPKCWPSQDTLCEMTGMGRSQVNRCLVALVDAGVLRRRRRGSTSTLYELITDVHSGGHRPSGVSTLVELETPLGRTSELHSGGKESTTNSEEKLDDVGSRLDGGDRESLLRLLTGRGVLRTAAHGLIETYPPDLIRSAIRECARQGTRIQNPAGFICHLLNTGEILESDDSPPPATPDEPDEWEVEKRMFEALPADERREIIEHADTSAALATAIKKHPSGRAARAVVLDSLSRSDPARYARLCEDAKLAIQQMENNR